MNTETSPHTSTCPVGDKDAEDAAALLISLSTPREEYSTTIPRNSDNSSAHSKEQFDTRRPVSSPTERFDEEATVDKDSGESSIDKKKRDRRETHCEPPSKKQRVSISSMRAIIRLYRPPLANIQMRHCSDNPSSIRSRFKRWFPDFHEQFRYDESMQGWCPRSYSLA